MAKGFVVPAGGGTHFTESPGRSTALKLLCDQTGQSIMMFEETVPAGSKSWLHLHHDSDEVAWVLDGEFTFKIGDEVTVGGPGTVAFMPRDVTHAWKNRGSGTGRALFLYTPAAAGRFIEEMHDRRGESQSDEDRDKSLQHHRWELLGPNPL